MTDNLCPGREETIHLYLDEELSQTDREEFVIHLQTCPHCQSLLAELQTLFSDLISWEEILAPPELVTQVIAHLPAPQPSARRVSTGQWVLAGQIVLGLILLLLAQPFLTVGLANPLLWQPGQILVGLAASLAGWLTEALVGLIGHLQVQWPPDLAFTGFNLSPPLGLALVISLSLVWLIGNRVLLQENSASFKNGGAS